jgi:hypothetical protein
MSSRHVWVVAGFVIAFAIAGAAWSWDGPATSVQAS